MAETVVRKFTHRTVDELPWERRGPGRAERKYEALYDLLEPEVGVWNVFTIDNRDWDPSNVVQALRNYCKNDGFESESTTNGRQVAIRIIGPVTQ